MTAERVICIVILPVKGQPRIEHIEYELERYQKIVGGYIEAVSLEPDAVMYLNEDGKILKLPVNVLATKLAHLKSGISSDDVIVGDAFIVGVPDDEGNDTPAPPWAIALVQHIGVLDVEVTGELVKEE